MINAKICVVTVLVLVVISARLADAQEKSTGRFLGGYYPPYYPPQPYPAQPYPPVMPYPYPRPYPYGPYYNYPGYYYGGRSSQTSG